MSGFALQCCWSFYLPGGFSVDCFSAFVFWKSARIGGLSLGGFLGCRGLVVCSEFKVFAFSLRGLEREGKLLKLRGGIHGVMEDESSYRSDPGWSLYQWQLNGFKVADIMIPRCPIMWLEKEGLLTRYVTSLNIYVYGHEIWIMVISGFH